MGNVFFRKNKINENVFNDDAFKKKMKYHPERLTQFDISHYEYEIDKLQSKLYRLLNREGQNYLAQAMRLLQKACLTSRTLNIPSHIAAMSRDEYVKYLYESYHDVDIDNDDLSQFDNIYSAEDYLRHELEFAREAGREDYLKDDIRKSYEDKKDRALSKQYNYFRELLSKLTDSEYEFLCYAVYEGNQHDNDCTLFSIDGAIDAWNDGTPEGQKLQNGKKIYNSIIKKGVAKETIENDITFYEIPYGLIDVMDLDFNYYIARDNHEYFIPCRKGSTWEWIHKPENYKHYKNLFKY